MKRSMTKQEIEQNIQKIADYYGLDNQTDKTIEECADYAKTDALFVRL